MCGSRKLAGGDSSRRRARGGRQPAAEGYWRAPGQGRRRLTPALGNSGSPTRRPQRPPFRRPAVHTPSLPKLVRNPAPTRSLEPTTNAMIELGPSDKRHSSKSGARGCTGTATTTPLPPRDPLRFRQDRERCYRLRRLRRSHPATPRMLPTPFERGDERDLAAFREFPPFPDQEQAHRVVRIAVLHAERRSEWASSCSWPASNLA